MSFHSELNGQGTDRTEVSLHPLQPLTVQPLVLELCRTLLARILVLLAMSPLAVHAAVLDEAAGRAVLELDDVAPLLAAVGADIDAINGHAAHFRAGTRLRRPQSRKRRPAASRPVYLGHRRT